VWIESATVSNKSVCVQLPASTDNVTLPHLLLCEAAAGTSRLTGRAAVDLYPGCRALSSKPAAAGKQRPGGTD